MKFSLQIKLNAFAEWSDHYMNYSNLKRLIYRIEKSLMSNVALPATSHDQAVVEIEGEDEINEAAPLLTPINPADADALFTQALDKELNRVVTFYREKEEELFDDVHQFEVDMSYLDAGQYMRRRSVPDLMQSGLLRDLEQEERRANSDGEETSPSHPPHALSLPMPAIGPDSGSSTPPIISGSPRTSGGGRQPRYRAKSESFAEWTDPVPPTSETRLNQTPPRAGPASADTYTSTIWDARNYKGHRQRFRRRAISLYVSLKELEKYSELNHTGFQKILKKFDKVTGRKLLNVYTFNKLSRAYPFLADTITGLSREISRVITHYARISTRNRPGDAKRELDLNLREHLVWERNTVWRDLVAIERGRGNVALKALRSKEDKPALPYAIKVCGRSVFIVYVPQDVILPVIKMLVCLAILPAILYSPIGLQVEAQSCLAILSFASALWATETLPLFVTSLCIPFLVVTMRVLRAPVAGGQFVRLTPKEATARIFADMFSPVIMLLLGGFALASALSKHHIAQWLAQIVLSRAGSSPRYVILANMLVSTLFSMFISNVAAPVLCFSLIAPILRNLPSKSPYAKSLVLGIALAANVGGMASPISSPQNIIAVNNMNPPPTWLEWLSISLPLCLVCDFAIWILLLVAYEPGRSTGEHAPAPPSLYSTHTPMKWTGTQMYVVFVLILTICLWCGERVIEPYVGDMGILAIVPLVAFFGTGVLSKDDFNSFLWNVVILAMGGIALGKAVDSSGLLAELTKQLLPHLEGMSVFQVVATVGCVVLVITSFVNHTVGALIILPVVAQLGTALPEPAPRTLVMCTALACSAAMGLHVSSFPNMNAISVEDPTGETWLTVSDFITRGIPASVVAFVGILSIAFGIMNLMHLDGVK
ncbi:hypothetical protein SmJEL517_g03805 [Synchytrium microbalum]|uniref:SPX domain-containing protein n=1 Tax=Synchytrium microbalum TaxID=1806994 RepID=A0A507BWM4_9FUNG|nr:uncharacterized protein SmJEL517_g03805 [Synchytrium microbalum]TPX33227.1 hypothetical protein SmJEL517_g03805 [Synchytrium microbalum]